MPGYDDDKIRDMIKKTADRQVPDAWRSIERSINNMENKNAAKKNRGLRALPALVTACAVVALAAVAAFGKPGFLLKPAATSAMPTVGITTPAVTAPVETVVPVEPTAPASAGQVRQPIPFADDTARTPDKAPSRKIMFHETLADLAKAEATTDIATFKFVKETGAESVDGGMGLYTSYEMQAVQVFKGDLKPGDTVTVRVFGGASDKVWIEDDFVERFTGDFDYVLFLGKSDDSGKAIYSLANPLQGYVPVQGGLVSLNTKIESNGLFEQGETLEALAGRIEAAVK